jgi:spoIIIJ-associated protein
MKKQLETIIRDMFNHMRLDLTDIQIEMKSPGEYYLNIDSDDSQLLTMWNGDVLRGLQHIISCICRSQKLFAEDEAHIKVDVNGYRKKQEESVIRIAEERISRALETKAPQALPPMSPYFRRLVHMHISEKYQDLTTESAGEGDQRHIRVIVKS